ncbi:hypothetical protein BWD09_03290 [Neisseria dentiae]|uniref:Lipoprotein n=1 Tax=Neisseria dentiae TaxID=194197 RepID=A0A1X3DFF7_9NEIS|nr:hypothetical protein [Neisseria dentiae]OSI18217.1 hypothetical protein BWD09_03290 [Neisseria dentiae]QMT44981.1 hypothetical protein H3L92_11330 [Neisseria dentiae]STZ50726.1 Uncharacterised protein [Neisseria dentiae]
MMNFKKSNLKRVASCLLLMLPLAACQKTPQELPPMYVDGQPVHTVPFYQPLEINPDKEQVFYFRFKKPQDMGKTVSVFASPIFPNSLDNNSKPIPEYQKYDELDRKLIDEKRLKFKLVLRHYDDNGKETAVGLREGGSLDYVYYHLQQNRQDKSKPARFESDEQYFVADYRDTRDTRQVKGETYLAHNVIAASFPVQEQGGYYKLMVTPLQQYPEYPELSMDIGVDWPSEPK